MTTCRCISSRFSFQMNNFSVLFNWQQNLSVMATVGHHIFKKWLMILSAHITYLALGVGFDLPASWQLQLSVCELVEENHQVPVVLVALEVPGIAAHLQDHVFHTAAAGEHPVGRLKREQ